MVWRRCMGKYQEFHSISPIRKLDGTRHSSGGRAVIEDVLLCAEIDYGPGLRIIQLLIPLMSDQTNPTKPARVNVLGVGISVLNLDLAVEQVARALESGQKGYICVTGVHGVSEAQADSSFRAVLNRAFLNTPDGMPMVWLGRLRGFRQMRRVYGPDLMLRVCEFSVRRGYTHFLYGGAEGVAQALKARLEARFPDIKIIGTFTPPFRPLTAAEEKDFASRLAEAKPDLVWVGLSTPKQEKFMSDHWLTLDAGLWFGVGAAFDFHAGRVRQAPRWMQSCGLEWFFRLCCEPRRLWKRYFRNNPLFVLRSLAQLTGLKRYPLDPVPESGSPSQGPS
jgi:N-acetylglucosaminyldiphosphoundecaprenol N-acetyl-beta-D-mannosaminyltransferase